MAPWESDALAELERNFSEVLRQMELMSEAWRSSQEGETEFVEAERLIANEAIPVSRVKLVLMPIEEQDDLGVLCLTLYQRGTEAHCSQMLYSGSREQIGAFLQQEADDPKETLAALSAAGFGL
jgi:hypothetical protein